MKELEKNICRSQNSKFPFVIYRKPHSEEIIGVFQKDNRLHYSKDLSGNGFIFAPFDDKNNTIVIPYSKARILKCKSEIPVLSKNKKEVVNAEDVKLNHIELVKKGIAYIKNSKLDKVVLSRKEEIEVVDFNILDTFNELCDFYPNAFVYLWSHPISGIWMGASPERLLTVKSNKFKIMALASTQKFNGVLRVEWGEKEREEHQIVIDYIADKMQDYNISTSDTYTVKAGGLLHLRADLEGEITDSTKSIKPLIQVLHPTPAVCGLPKDESKLFILENEQYNREYYTGFLGELSDREADLFVNLRCMKIDLVKSMATLFVGGGITKDSIPEKEWLETVAKTNVMKKVLL